MNETLVVASTPDDLEEEKRLQELNRLGFVRAKSAEDQWYILVNEGWRVAKLPPDEIVHYYLVKMLSRFTDQPKLFDQLNIFNYAQYVFGGRKVDSSSAQEIADLSLQYVALFPERSRHRHEQRSLEYVSNLGVSLYTSLSRTYLRDEHRHRVFGSMSNKFGIAVLVLRAAFPRFHTEANSKTNRESGTHIPTNEETRALCIFEHMHLESEYPPISRNN